MGNLQTDGFNEDPEALPFEAVWEFPRLFHEQNGIPDAEESVLEMSLQLDSGIVQQTSKVMKQFAEDLESHPSMRTDLRTLRAQLMVEELSETLKAMMEGDLVELADGLADLLYVIGGTIITFGLSEAMGEVFKEVQRANMSKAGSLRVRDKGEDWIPPRIAEILEAHNILD